MNVLKNMEAIFTVALALACSASYVALTRPEPVSVAQIPVVVVHGKRMTAQEKVQSLIEERQQAQAAGAGSRM